MTLKRPKQPMPAFVLDALNKHALMEAYDLRPPYQQNDYLWWINSAKRDTKNKRGSPKCWMNLKRAMSI